MLQTFVESVHLHDEEMLKAQTNENDDIFRWLKLQARNGVPDAEVTKVITLQCIYCQNVRFS